MKTKVIFLAVLSTTLASSAAELYVAPNGSASGTGTRSNPLDLATAISTRTPARPGDTIWMLGGTYRGSFESRLSGTAGNPITLRQAPGERATIDGNGGSTYFTFNIHGAWAVYRDFELWNSHVNRAIGATRAAGVNVYGPNTKLVNLIIHDTGLGIGAWTAALEAEIYGCLIYNVGWQDPPDPGGKAGTGHSIYMQNDTGTKWVHDNIACNSFGYGVHAYGQSGPIRGYDLQGNILFGAGMSSLNNGTRDNVLIGGDTPSQRVTVISNYLYHVPSARAANLRLNYRAPGNTGLLCKENVVSGGGLGIQALDWADFEISSNVVYCTSQMINAGPYATLTGRSILDYNQYFGGDAYAFRTPSPPNLFYSFRNWQTYCGREAHSTVSTQLPTGPRVFVRPNRYQAKRAHVAIYNWGQADNVSVDLAGVLRSGDTFEVRNAANFWGAPLRTGTYTGGAVLLPMTNLQAVLPAGSIYPPIPPDKAFNAFIVLGTGTDTGTTTPTNTAPSISGIADQTIAANTPRAVNFTVSDNETAAGSLNVSASSSNPTLVPNGNFVLGGSGSERTVTITPAVGQAGTTTVTLTVSDGALSASRSFSFTVSAPVVVNTAPTLSAIADQSTSANTPRTVNFTVSDNESSAGSLNVTVSSSNPTLVPNGNVALSGGGGSSRTATITPAANQSGTTIITLTVSDGALSASRSFSFTVSAPVVVGNTPPLISAIADQFISANASRGVAFAVSDAETPLNRLTVSASSSNQELVPDANIVLGVSDLLRTAIITPLADRSGTTTITLTVSDGALSTSRSFVLTVSAPTLTNTPPSVSPVPDSTTDEDTPVTVTFDVTDGQTLPESLSVTAASSNPLLVPTTNIVLSGTGRTRTARIAPWINRSGQTTITLQASDGSKTGSSSFVLRVNAVNDAPILSAIPNLVCTDGGVGSVTFVAADAETVATNLTVSANASDSTLVPSENMVITSSGPNRTLTVRPATNKFGEATITVTVSDRITTMQRSFRFTSRSSYTGPTVSTITNQVTDEDTPLALGFTVGDRHTAAGKLVVAAFSSNPALIPNTNIVITGSESNRSMILTPWINRSGSARITLTVAYGSAITSNSFNVTVSPVNDPPIITAIPNQSTTPGVARTVTLIVADAESAATNLTLSGNSSNPALVPNDSIVFGGAGNNRTATITSAPNQTGTSVVAIVVSDGKATASRTFNFVVQSPATNQTVRVATSLSGETGRGNRDDSRTPPKVNPFAPLKGQYCGLLFDTNGIAHESSGAFHLTVSERGAVSGTLSVGGARHSIHGRFDPVTGMMNVSLSRGAQSPLTVALQLDLTGASEQISGTVNGGDWTAVLLGDRAAFNVRTNPAPFAGRYELVIPGADDPANGPTGRGVGAAVVDANGQLRFTGVLADGTRVTHRSALSRNGQWPFYQALYGGRGSLISWVTFTGEPRFQSQGLLSWIRPAMPRHRQFPEGFTVETILSGERSDPR